MIDVIQLGSLTGQYSLVVGILYNLALVVWQ